jgi:hypothetical protein
MISAYQVVQYIQSSRDDAFSAEVVTILGDPVNQANHAE